MIRFIIKVKTKEDLSGAEYSRMFTFDADVQELERQLTRGGFSQYGYEVAELIGVEVLDSRPAPEKSEVRLTLAQIQTLVEAQAERPAVKEDK